MRKAKTNDITLFHDGKQWRLFEGDALQPVCEAPGAADELPEPILTACAGVKSVPIVLSGEVLALDFIPARRSSFDEAQHHVAARLAEISGREADDLVPLFRTLSWRGRRGAVTLAAAFEKLHLETLRETLAETEARPGGFTRFELAAQSLWCARGAEKTASLLVVGEAFTYLVPAARPGNSGPRSFAGGVRHFQSDAENWALRIRRAVPDTSGRLHLVTASSGIEPQLLVDALREAGYSDVRLETRDAFIHDALAEIRGKRKNTFSDLPIVNPYEPRKLFSHGWIVIPSVAILLIPFAVAFGMKSYYDGCLQSLRVAEQPHLALESQIRSAEKAAQAAEKELAELEGYRQTLVARRQPLNAFINMAYFFAKHAGGSVCLNSIAEADGRVNISGTFSDPEDGVRLTEKLGEFLEEHQLKLLFHEVKDGVTAEGYQRSSFQITVETIGVGK